jgi:hypothetical protein
MEETMTRRLTAALFVLALVAAVPAGRLAAHEGHDHKVMGTVTMAAADHVMLKDRAGKDVTVWVNNETQVKAKQPTRPADIKPATRVVVTAVMEGNNLIARVIEVGVTEPRN